MLKDEKLNSAKILYNTRKDLQDEIESLKEREISLKATNDLLQKGLDDQKRANLDGANEGKNLSIERNLILEERVSKAEADSEKMRGERLLAVDELKAIKQKLSESQFKCSQIQMELNNANNNLSSNKVPLKQLEELNNENKALTLERNDLQQKLSEKQIDQGKLSKHEAEQGLQDLKTQLSAVKQAYQDLKQAQDANQDQAAAVPQNKLLHALYSALVRARTLFQQLESRLDQVKEGDAQIE